MENLRLGKVAHVGQTKLREEVRQEYTETRKRRRRKSETHRKTSVLVKDIESGESLTQRTEREDQLESHHPAFYFRILTGTGCSIQIIQVRAGFVTGEIFFQSSHA